MSVYYVRCLPLRLPLSRRFGSLYCGPFFFFCFLLAAMIAPRPLGSFGTCTYRSMPPQPESRALPTVSLSHSFSSRDDRLVSAVTHTVAVISIRLSRCRFLFFRADSHLQGIALLFLPRPWRIFCLVFPFAMLFYASLLGRGGFWKILWR